MKFFNCTLEQAIEDFKDDRIIVFGRGSWCNVMQYSKIRALESQIAYFIDNKPGGVERFGSREFSVYPPEVLRDEISCIVILTSPVYMYDMYCQLDRMSLPDSIRCLAYPFAQMVSGHEMDQNLLERVTDASEQKIPKTIHSFWFSGEEKPESYKRCVDTWSENLLGYQIHEWNCENYEYDKHPFLKKAIECGAWAFATDFARLDVLSKYGGIYLDMDVEVFRDFDRFLGNEAIFSFSNNVQIDLAVMGSVARHPLVKRLLHLYDDVDIPSEKEGFSKYFQPSFVVSTLSNYGFEMNGTLQEIDGAVAFPSEFFMPQEHILFQPYSRTEYTTCNHLDNFGWSFHGENKREKKIVDNRKLWKCLESASSKQ